MPELISLSKNRALTIATAGLLTLGLVGCANEDRSGAPGSPNASEPAIATGLPSQSARVTADASPFPLASRSPAGEWRRIELPGDDSGWTTVTQAVRGAGGYLALGVHMQPANEVGYASFPRLWTSPEGEAWAVAPAPPDADYPVSLLEGPDSTFLLYSNSLNADNEYYPAVLSSADARSWHSAPAALPLSLRLIRVVHGPKGYLLAAEPEEDSGLAALWWSPDGMDWRPVQTLVETATSFEVIVDVGAGEEGFVALGSSVRPDVGSTDFVLASSDGIHWVRSDDPFGNQGPIAEGSLITPVGPDWVAAVGRTGSSSRFLWSANGLDWEWGEPIADAPPVSPLLVATGDRVLYSSTATMAPVGEPGGWTTDGAGHWAPLYLGHDGVIGGAYTSEDGPIVLGSVIVSDQRSHPAIWVSDSE